MTFGTSVIHSSKYYTFMLENALKLIEDKILAITQKWISWCRSVMENEKKCTLKMTVSWMN